MFGANHYVPVLKWKRAEQAALQALPAATRARLTPLLEIVSIPTDLDTGAQLKTLEQHATPALDKLVTAWGTESPVFLDPEDVAGDHAANGTSGTAFIFAGAQARSVHFVPVTGLRRAPADQAAAVSHRQRGLCLRLTAEDFAVPTLAANVTGFLAAHGLPPDTVDIVLDLEAMTDQTAFVVQSTMIGALAALPTVGAWRTVTVVASSFPAHMGVVQTHGTLLRERSEWIAWLALHAQRAGLPRLPTFGDYGIQHPTGVEGYDPRYMPMSATIRYTLPREWLFIKGQSVKRSSAATQFPALAAQLVAAQGHYYGATHCPGCAEAQQCAAGGDGFGSPEVWRRIGTSHHLTVATTEVSGVAYP